MRARRKTVECWRPSGVGLHDHHPLPPGERADPIAVEEPEPLLSAFMAVSPQNGGNIQLDQLLQAACCQLGDQLTGRAAIE